MYLIYIFFFKEKIHLKLQIQNINKTLPTDF